MSVPSSDSEFVTRADASVYETEHGRMRGLSKGHDLADLAGFYGAFGLPLDTLSAGAVRLARVGYWGPLAIFAAIAVVGAIASTMLVRRMRVGPVVDPPRRSPRPSGDPA